MNPDLSSILERLQGGEETRIAGLGDSLTYGWEVRHGFFDRFVDGLQGGNNTSLVLRRTA